MLLLLQVSLRLNTSQNDLLIASATITILSCSTAFGSYIAGAFGMNLDQTVDGVMEYPFSFTYVAVGSFGLVCILAFCIYTFLTSAGFIPSRIAPDSLEKIQ